MVPMELDEQEQDHHDEDFALDGEHEARFFTCHVCGDNWLSVKQTDLGGDCRITFVHQMGMEPTLKRVAHMATPVVLSDRTVDRWAYYLGEDEVEERKWRRLLNKRRRVLRSICTN